ncbi:MAG TPA: helix-turn-helix domain-containing protein [candidate division Zixibacteria bacterium]|nr:helix-turn-helix domain-containing protein [candidate division Zixibacteria bacterium]
MIVDDDVEMLNGLEHLIVWEDLGFTIAGTADNGKKGLELVRRCKPGLLITDITMPAVDGFSLIRQASGICPNIKTIILTCHEDFSFAHQAIELAVEDYLVKVTLTADELVRSLVKVREKLAIEADHRQIKQIVKQELSSSRYQLTADFFLELIANPPSGRQEVQRRCDHLNMTIPPQRYRPLALFIDDCVEKHGGDKAFKPQQVKHLMMSYLEQERWLTKGSSFFPYRGDCIMMLLPWQPERHTSGYPLLEKIKIFQRKTLQKLGLNVSVCIGGVAEGIHTLKKAVRQVLTLRDSCFYRGLGSIVNERPDEFAEAAEEQLYLEVSESFRLHLISLDEPRLDALLADLFHRIEQERHSPETVRLLLRRLTADLESVANRYGITLQGELADAPSFELCRKRFAALVDGFLKQIRLGVIHTSRKEINTVLNFIDRHLNEPIRCETMALLVNLNSDYFSRLFKKETGMSFTDYLIQRRIVRAKDLLLHTNITIDEITRAIGLENPSYFYRLFKRHIGMTPKELRAGGVAAAR